MLALLHVMVQSKVPKQHSMLLNFFTVQTRVCQFTEGPTYAGQHLASLPHESIITTLSEWDYQSLCNTAACGNISHMSAVLHYWLNTLHATIACNITLPASTSTNCNTEHHSAQCDIYSMVSIHHSASVSDGHMCIGGGEDRSKPTSTWAGTSRVEA